MQEQVVGKREFILHTSKFLNLAAEQVLIITHHGKPVLKLTPTKPKTMSDLRGTLPYIKGAKSINQPTFPGFDQW